MARAVLGFVFRWVKSLVLAAVLLAPAHGAGPIACSSGNLNPETHTFQERIAAGAFYKEMLLRFGKPLACTVAVQEGTTSLTYTFPRGVQLIAKTDAKIEFSEQSVKPIHMETATAMALLKRAERDAYPPGGCGIGWTGGEKESQAGAGGDHEVIYRGDTCNCQARLIYKDKYVVTLVLRSAC
jgi:hypothetical protein